jgi:hypothetical protein
MRVKTNLLTGDAEVWDPVNPDPFISLAAEQFIGQEGDTALVRTMGGCILHAHPGWLAIALGDSGVTFLTPENFGDGADCTWSRA